MYSQLRTMASGEDTAITTQPRSKRKELEQFVRDLDPIQVVGKWKESECYLAMRAAAAPSVYELSAIRKLVPYPTLVNAIECRSVPMVYRDRRYY